MNHVALASDQHPVYEFFAPLSAAVWQQRIGYSPVVLLIGSELAWRTKATSRTVLAALTEMGVSPEFVECPDGYRTANAAQIVRMYGYAAAAVERDDDRIVTSDVDMWPIDRDWFAANEPVPGEVSCYYANYPSRFPMCYVSAHRGTWSEMLGDASRGVQALLREHLTTQLSPETNWADAWQHDEEYLTARIHARPDYPASCRMVIRAQGDPFPDRVDRVVWPPTLMLTGKRDAHLLRPGFEDQSWRELGKLLRLLCPDLISWAETYRNLYLASGR